LRQSGTLKRDALYWHYPHLGNQGGEPGGIVRRGDFKLIHFYEDDRCELYNLREDIGEQHDLAAQMPEKVAELRALHQRWLKEVDATLCPVNPDFDPQKPRPGGTYIPRRPAVETP